MPKPKSFEISLSLPFGLGGIKGTWQPSREEAEAAWEMYVELVTRVATVGLTPGQGVLREALTSLNGIFGITRDILRRHGPVVAKVSGNASYSFGSLAVAILNDVLRPFLTEWHPRLLEYESQRGSNVSIAEHERQWEDGPALRESLADVRRTLLEFTKLLARVAEIPSLVPTPDAALAAPVK